MDFSSNGKERLRSAVARIVGEDQEWIILDYKAYFRISEYEDVFALNAALLSISDCEISDEELKVLFVARPSWEDVFEAVRNEAYSIVNVNEVSSSWSTAFVREELFGRVLVEEGYNTLFHQPIPEEMADYMDYPQIYTCLSMNDGWIAVAVDGVDYLVRF